MLVTRKNIVGMVLVIMLFSATVPILMGVRSSPDSLFKGEDVVTLTQTNLNTPLKAELAKKLKSQDFVEAASAEIYAFSYIISRKTGEYEPVLVRGGEPEDFLKIEDAMMLTGDYGGNFMLVGESLSRRLELDRTDKVTISGSTHPAIFEGTISGIFRSEGAADDQILIPLECARKLTGLAGDIVLAIRVRIQSEERLIDFLTDEEVSVIVSKKDGVPISVNENKTFEEQLAEELAIKFWETGKYSASNESFISTFIQKGGGTVGVVVLGFITLNALLTFIGTTAILARGVIERRKDIGILAAIGARRRSIYMFLLKDLLIISVIASGIGVLLGFVVANFVSSMNLIVAFGITIQPSIEIALFIATFLVAVFIGCSSGLLVSSVIMSERPSRLMSEAEDVKEELATQTLSEALGV